MAQGTPEIPGFQPLGIRGGGELGIWIEARQVRLDRRVLLKVLPASESHLESEFLREVRAMVQLDGRGVLRVIEEGQAGKARFVALDEAGSLRPEPGMLAPNEVVQLADEPVLRRTGLGRPVYASGATSFNFKDVPRSS